MRHLIVAVMLLALPFVALGQTTAPHPLSADSSVDDILDALHVRGQNLQDFSGDVRLADANTATSATKAEEGKVYFQRKGPGDARIRVTFDKAQSDMDKPKKSENHQYTLDDGWLIERDYVKKKEIRTQVLPPGEKFDPLELGKGAFPLPIGQDKEEVKRLFDVSKVAPDKDDPAGTIHLLLSPRPGTKYADQKSVDVWIDPTNSMPRRITVMNKLETTEKTTDITNVKINAGLGDKDLTLPGNTDSGWDRFEQPLK